MNIYFTLQPRQSGKTHMAIYEFLKSPQNTLFIVHNKDAAENINIKTYYLHHKNIITSSQLSNFGNLHKYKNIVLDEYLFFKNYDEIYKIITENKNNFENLYIFTTSNKKYSKIIIEYLKQLKFLKYEYIKETCKYDPNELYELYYNFITDPDIVLIDRMIYRNKFPNDLKNYYNNESYDIEIKNIYLK